MAAEDEEEAGRGRLVADEHAAEAKTREHNISAAVDEQGLIYFAYRHRHRPVK